MTLSSLSIVIPCYNESKRIKNTLRKIQNYLKKEKIKCEIIIVDDGSSDDTITVISGFENITLLQNAQNMGKGYSIKKGMLASKGRYSLFTDADLSTPIEELRKLKKYIGKYDIIIGSRKERGSMVVQKQPFYRVWAGNLFPILTRILTGLNIKDTQCGFKLFNMKKCRKVFEKMTIDGFSFDVEMLYIAKKQGLKIKEVGVDWYNNEDSKVNLIKHSIQMFFDIVKIRIRGILGIYEKN